MAVTRGSAVVCGLVFLSLAGCGAQAPADAAGGAGGTAAAPSGLVATPSAGKVSLSWGAVAGATGYEVFRTATVSGPFSRITATAQATTTYADTAVLAGTTYWYQVRAVNAAGTSAPSAIVSAAVPAPLTPVRVTVSPASATVDGCRTTRFTAQVTGSPELEVNWSVLEGAAGGTIDATGTYTAPDTAGTYNVIATSRASGEAVATATVVVQERVLSVAVTPGSASVAPGAPVQFAATVTTTCGSFAAL